MGCLMLIIGINPYNEAAMAWTEGILQAANDRGASTRSISEKLHQKYIRKQWHEGSRYGC